VTETPRIHVLSPLRSIVPKNPGTAKSVLLGFAFSTDKKEVTRQHAGGCLMTWGFYRGPSDGQANHKNRGIPGPGFCLSERSKVLCCGTFGLTGIGRHKLTHAKYKFLCVKMS
jgi:hypothetical protein